MLRFIHKQVRSSLVGRRNSNVRARGNLRSESKPVHPALGALHPVIYSEELDFFYSDVDTALTNVVEPLIKANDHGRVHSRPGFRLFDDVSKAGIRVLERRMSEHYASKHRLRWTGQDVGRIKSRIKDEIADLGIGFPLRAKLDNVVLLGDADETKQRYFGLTLDPESVEAEFITEEHSLVINGIQSSFAGFRNPYSQYVPHLTLGRLDRSVPLEQRQRALNAVRLLLPLEVQLDPLIFTAKQVI